jgi:hypothetical protein
MYDYNHWYITGAHPLLAHADYIPVNQTIRKNNNCALLCGDVLFNSCNKLLKVKDCQPNNIKQQQVKQQELLVLL